MGSGKTHLSISKQIPAIKQKVITAGPTRPLLGAKGTSLPSTRPSDGIRRANLFYNKHELITKVQFPPRVDQNFKDEVYNLLSPLIGIEIVVSGDSSMMQTSKEDPQQPRRRR